MGVAKQMMEEQLAEEHHQQVRAWLEAKLGRKARRWEVIRAYGDYAEDQYWENLRSKIDDV